MEKQKQQLTPSGLFDVQNNLILTNSNKINPCCF